MTSPDWVPFMRRAAALVTDSGGMTSHAAIVSRELGVPCIVGARTATTTLKNGMLVTVDATAGVVLAGEQKSSAASAATTRFHGCTGRAVGALVTATKLMVNLGEPERASEIAARPVDGVGLLRAEFMLLSAFDGVHPRRLIEQGRSEQFVDADGRPAAGRSPSVRAAAGHLSRDGLPNQRVPRTRQAARSSSRTKRTR